MKTKLLLIAFIILAVIVGQAAAVDFNPGGDINMRNKNIKNADDVNATRFCAGSSCTTDFSTLGADGFWSIAGSKYLYNNSNVLDVNETALNNTIESYGYITSPDDNVSGSELETLFSTTIGLLYRSAAATYQSIALGTHFQVSGGIFQLITGSIKAADLNLTDITLGDFTDDLGDRGYTDLSNFTNGPGYITSYTDTWNTTQDMRDAVNNSDVNILGNAGTATALAANGANCAAGQYPLGVDASGAVESCTADQNTQLSQEQVEDYVGGMVSGTETHISVTYDDTGGNLNYVVADDWYNSASDVIGGFSGTCSSSTYLRGDGACATPASGGGSSYDQSLNTTDDVTFNTVTITNPPVECNVNNSFMTQFAGNQSTCRELNQSLINTADLNNDAGFITTDTNANTLCSGTTTYLDGEGNCDDISSVYQAAGTYYSPGGTDVAIGDGGTGASLTDPNADRILFWDDSSNAMTWLTASTGLTISTTSMTVRSASTTQTGIAETATNAEVTTGTDTARYITPSSLTSITKLGTIGTGVWQGTAIGDSYISSASTWNAKYGSGDAATLANVTISSSGTVGGNSTCLILYSPNGGTTLEVCN